MSCKKVRHLFVFVALKMMTKFRVHCDADTIEIMFVCEQVEGHLLSN